MASCTHIGDVGVKCEGIYISAYAYMFCDGVVL